MKEGREERVAAKHSLVRSFSLPSRLCRALCLIPARTPICIHHRWQFCHPTFPAEIRDSIHQAFFASQNRVKANLLTASAITPHLDVCKGKKYPALRTYTCNRYSMQHKYVQQSTPRLIRRNDISCMLGGCKFSHAISNSRAAQSEILGSDACMQDRQERWSSLTPM